MMCDLIIALLIRSLSRKSRRSSHGIVLYKKKRKKMHKNII